MKMTGEPYPADLLVRLSLDLNGSFEELMLAYQDRIYSFALRLAAYRGLQGYEPERIRSLAVRPWLYRIALNVCRNRIRRKRVTTVDFDRDASGDSVSGEETAYQPVAPESTRPEAIVEHGELQARLGALVAGLPERYRAAVILRFIEGLSYVEVAEALGQPVGTVKSNVHRGIEQLRNRILLGVPSREVEYERQ
jgi:RNA polymerase sigma-70 factor (ECF subfamily)